MDFNLTALDDSTIFGRTASHDPKQLDLIFTNAQLQMFSWSLNPGSAHHFHDQAALALHSPVTFKDYRDRLCGGYEASFIITMSPAENDVRVHITGNDLQTEYYDSDFLADMVFPVYLWNTLISCLNLFYHSEDIPHST